jgi:hypothetical protein
MARPPAAVIDLGPDLGQCLREASTDPGAPTGNDGNFTGKRESIQ